MPSRFYLDKFIEWGWTSDKLVYIPNCIDANLFRPEYNPGSYFLYFGRLSSEKGIDTLIKAASLAGVTLKIVGTGPEENKLRAVAAEAGIETDFLGYKSGEVLQEIIQNSRAIVLPAEWYENAPMSILESYALGKPVIGAKIGGIPEMVVTGQTGWLFESGNIDDLADCLCQVAKMPLAELKTYGENARSYVCQQFSRERYVNSILDLYRSVGVMNV